MPNYAYTIGTTFINLSWGDDYNAERLIVFDITVNQQVMDITMNPALRTYEITNLIPGHEYDIDLRYINAENQGVDNWSRIITLSYTVNNGPQNEISNIVFNNRFFNGNLNEINFSTDLSLYEKLPFMENMKAIELKPNGLIMETYNDLYTKFMNFDVKVDSVQDIQVAYRDNYLNGRLHTEFKAVSNMIDANDIPLTEGCNLRIKVNLDDSIPANMISNTSIWKWSNGNFSIKYPLQDPSDENFGDWNGSIEHISPIIDPSNSKILYFDIKLELYQGQTEFQGSFGYIIRNAPSTGFQKITAIHGSTPDTFITATDLQNLNNGGILVAPISIVWEQNLDNVILSTSMNTDSFKKTSTYYEVLDSSTIRIHTQKSNNLVIGTANQLFIDLATNLQNYGMTRNNIDSIAQLPSLTNNSNFSLINNIYTNLSEANSVKARHDLLNYLFAKNGNVTQLLCTTNELGINNSNKNLFIVYKSNYSQPISMTNVYSNYNRGLYVNLINNNDYVNIKFDNLTVNIKRVHEVNQYGQILVKYVVLPPQGSGFSQRIYNDGDIANIFGYRVVFGGLTVDNLGEVDITCLTEDTQILTPNGYSNIKELKKGDLVLTDDNREVEIKNIHITYAKGNANNFPYLIKKNSIAKNYPPQDFKVSGRHAIKFGDNWILPQLAENKFVQDKSQKIIKYYHIELENYAKDNLVINGGAIVESFGGNNLDNKMFYFKEENGLYSRISYKDAKKFLSN